MFADSAGFCQNPSCLTVLFHDSGKKPVHIAEMAHICAAADNGPRVNSTLTKSQRAAYENLLLLCANCHTKVDKDPAGYPDSLMLEWKRRHAERASAAFGMVEYGERSRARAAIEPLLVENRTIFSQYGPDLDYRHDPESELADAWQRKVLAHILPNNRRLLCILDVNRGLLTSKEIEVLEEFRQHVDDLENRHVGGGANAVASRFPKGMGSVLVSDGGS